jgi:hypothetical protein
MKGEEQKKNVNGLFVGGKLDQSPSAVSVLSYNMNQGTQSDSSCEKQDQT